MKIRYLLVLALFLGIELSASDKITFELAENLDVSKSEFINNKHLLLVPDKDLFTITIDEVKYREVSNIASSYQEDDGLWYKGENVDINYQGVKRHLDILRLNFPIFKSSELGDSVLVRCSYEIDYGVQLPKKEAKLNTYLLSAFSGIANLNDLPRLISYIKNQKRDQLLAGDNWMDPNLDYVKLTTKTDGFAEIQASDIIDMNPKWSGISTNELQLLYRGDNYPVYFSSPKFTSDTKILFQSKRAMGDTTWFDNYAGEEPYFLVRNVTDNPLDISPLKIASGNNPILSTVKIARHIEEEKVYSFGDTVYSHYTLPFEGWYWDIVEKYEKPNSLESRRFTADIALSKSENPLDLKLRYNTQLNYNHSRSDFGISLRINGKVHDSVYVQALGEGFLTNDKNIKLYPGIANLEVRSYGIKDDVGRVGIDYLLMSGEVEPHAYEGKAEFDIASQPSNFRLSVPGFSRSEVIVYDTLSKSIALMNTVAGSSFRANVVNEDVKFATIIINDSIYTSNEAGIHIASIDNSGNWNTSFHTSGNQNAIDAINALKDKSFTVCVNKFPISDKIKSALESLSAKSVPSASGMTYILYGKTGERVEEVSKLSENGISDFVEHTSGLSYKAEIDLKADTEYSLMLIDKSHYDVPKLYRVDKVDILAQDKKYDAILLTHADLVPSAIAYKEFRAEQNIEVKIVDVNNIYDRFNYGKKSPHAIKEYLKTIYNTWVEPIPTNILIVGDASWDNRDVMQIGKTKDYIPTYGWPATDYWYSLMDGEIDLIGDYGIGRVPVNSNEEMLGYIDKIRVYENAPKSPWMKKSLHLSGGADKEEIDRIYNRTLIHGTLLHQEPLCMDTIHIVKPVGDIVSEGVASKIKNAINNGVSFVTFYGHGSPVVFDIEGWQVEKLNNKDRYFGLMTLSCNTGAFAEPEVVNSRNESYVIAANKGAIAAVGGTGIENGLQVHNWAKYFWEGVIKTNLNIRSFGDMILYPKATLDMVAGYVPIRFQTNLIGDPMVKLRLASTPDPYLDINYVNIENEEGSSEFTDENQTLKISGTINNYGIAYTDSVVLRLKYLYEGEEFTEDLTYNSILNSREFNFDIPIKSKPGKYNISLQIDPENKISGDDLNNNFLSYDIDVFKKGLLPLEPLAYWDINASNPKFRFINPLEGEFTYKFIISENRGDTVQTVYSSIDEEVEVKENYILWNSSASLISGKNYWLAAKPVNVNNDTPAIEWSWIPVHAGQMQPNKARFVKNRNNLEAHKFNNVDVYENGTEKDIQLKDENPEYYLVSIKGKNIDGVNTRWATITVDNQTYIDIWSARGFNVVTYPKKLNSGKARYKRFDCYREDVNSDKNLENVYELHSFLKDSVRDDEYLAIATCDNSLSWQEYIQATNPGDFGSLDTLKKLLKMYGAHHVDSIHSQTSYALFSWKGASEEEADESINMVKDSAMVTGRFTRYQMQGDFSSDPIGPAKSWDKVKFTGNELENSNLEIFVRDTLNQTSLYGEFNPADEIDLSNIDASVYPFVSYKIDLIRKEISELPSISQIELDYNPSPELALVKSSFTLDKEKVLRGEENSAGMLVENISGRSTIAKSEAYLQIYKNMSLAEQYATDLENMPVDASTLIEQTFGTEGLAENNEIYINANPHKKYFTEQYSFNNTYSRDFILEEDTIKPTAIILADNNVIGDKSFVADSPLFEVRVYDNSLLDFTNGIEPVVRLNGKYYTEDNAQFYNLEFFEKSEDSLKAILQVRPDTITYEESLMITYLMDATGNRDTIEYYLYTTTKSQINEVSALPNPFDEETEIVFNLVASSAEGKAEIKIFNAEGQRVKSITLETLYVGRNSIKWDGTDQNGIPLPSGAYYFSVVRNSDFYTEESYGKVIIAR